MTDGWQSIISNGYSVLALRSAPPPPPPPPVPSIVNESPYKDKADTPSLVNIEVFNIDSGSFFRYSQKVRELTTQVGPTVYTNNKVKIVPPPTFESNFLDKDGVKVLSPFRSIVSIDKKRRQNIGRNRVSISFSPSEVINQNIVRNIGLENINNVLGLPSGFYKYREKTLEKIKRHYNQYHYINVDYNNYIRIVSEIGLVLDQVIDYFIPARANLLKGVVIESNLLERPRVKLIKNIKTYGAKTRRTINAVGSLTGSAPDYAATFNLSKTINTIDDATVKGTQNKYNANLEDQATPDPSGKTSNLKTIVEQPYLNLLSGSYNTLKSTITGSDVFGIHVSPQPQSIFQLKGLVTSGSSELLRTNATYNTKTVIIDSTVVNLNKVKYDSVNEGTPGAEPYNRVYPRKLFTYEINTPRLTGNKSLYVPGLYEIPPSADFRDIGVTTYFNNRDSIYTFPEKVRTPVYRQLLNLKWDNFTQQFDNIQNWQYGTRYKENDVVYQNVNYKDEGTLGNLAKSALAGNKKYYVFKTKPLYQAPTENVSYFLDSTPSYLPPSLDKENWELLLFKPSIVQKPKRLVFDTFVVGRPELNNYKLTTISVDTIISIPSRYVDSFSMPAVNAFGYSVGELTIQNIFTLFAAQSNISDVRLRLYRTREKRDNDISRAIETKPTGDHGVLLDMVFGEKDSIEFINPIPTLTAGGVPPNATIYFTLNNLSSSSQTVSNLLLYYFAIEVEPRFPRGHLRKHYRNFRDNSTATKRRTRYGCKNTVETTIDGRPPVQVFLSEGNQLTISPTQTNTEIITGGGGTLNVT